MHPPFLRKIRFHTTTRSLAFAQQMTWNSGSYSFLIGIVETAQHGLKTFKAIIALRQEYNTIILTLGSRGKNAEKLLQRMYATPIVKARTVEKELNISFSSANRLLKSLTALGVLKETTGHSRNRLFVLEKYLNLFRN